MFLTHKMTYIGIYWKKVNLLFILYFLEDLRPINNPCFKQSYNTIKEDKAVFVTEYLDQSSHQD